MTDDDAVDLGAVFEQLTAIEALVVSDEEEP